MNWSNAPGRESRKHSDDYYLFEIDKNPVACVALHIYPGTEKRRTGLSLCQPLARKPGHRPQADPICGSKARELGLSELITLSTQAFTYFQSKGGFQRGTPDDLPPGRREIRSKRPQFESAGEETESDRASIGAAIGRRTARDLGAVPALAPDSSARAQGRPTRKKGVR